ncbi:hypothetical protein S40288_02499 [Stachybotrys chartarum IBT 40288]|nr:hypothetical protein S40288_02499 [Stachybotrys chartarum IBT 40288]
MDFPTAAKKALSRRGASATSDHRISLLSPVPVVRPSLPTLARGSRCARPCIGRIPGTVAALTILSHNETSELSLQQHLELAPDLVAYNPLVSEGDPEPLMMAQSVPHQATDKKRVKVYELRNNDWFDRGTGFCTADYMTTESGRKEPRVLVESEDQPERLLLETKIQREDGFQKQQGKTISCKPKTLIVWQEPGSGVDMALSFQEAEGCALIWRFVSGVQQTLHGSLGGVDDAFSDSELPLEAQTTISLPTADLGHLAEIESTMRQMNNTPHGRDALAKFIMADDYISKLIPLVEMAEDLESLADLHRLCNIMKLILLLNDTSIIEHAVSDECVLGVVGALEYDPDFPSHKANHRHWLDNQGRYKEVVPIEDEQTQRKIHQTYRLLYLKDVVLARILDDPTFSVLNSLIFFNQVDIVNFLQMNTAFLNDLFGLVHSTMADQKKRKDAVLFIQQCCGIAKNIQPPARQSLYNNFISHGLLNVIHFGLRHGDASVRVGAMDILISTIEHDANMIRQTMYRQIHDNQSPLTDSLIDLLLVEVDLGVKSQISEALKVLLDPGAPPQSGQENAAKSNGDYPGRARALPGADSQQELFLTRFYERSAAKLFKPLLELNSETDMNFSLQQASMFTYLVELLCFFVRHHHRFSRYFLMEHDVTQRITQFFRCEEKYLQLLAVRFFRSLVGMQEEFYTQHLKEKAIFGSVLDVIISTLPRDNLLCSASIELFEFIRKENLKDLVKHVLLNYQDRLDKLNHLFTFYYLRTRFDKAQSEPEVNNMDCFLEPEEEVVRKPPPSRMMEHITIDPRQDEYWNEPDELEEGTAEGTTGDKTSPANALSTLARPLVDYASDDEAEEGMDAAGPETATDSNSPKSASTLPVVAPPERLSEKRRREEDDEDDLGKLMQSKRRNSTSATGNGNTTTTTGGIARRRKSFTAGSGNGTPKKISISLSPAVRTNTRSNEES